MLTLQTALTDFEGFRFINQSFTIRELSVRDLDCNRNIFLKPPFSIQAVSVKAQNSYTWITNYIHDLNWDSGIHDYTFFHCFFLSQKVRFLNIIIYAKGDEKRLFHRNFFIRVNQLDHVNYSNASELDRTAVLVSSSTQDSHEIITHGKSKLVLSLAKSVSAERLCL